MVRPPPLRRSTRLRHPSPQVAQDALVRIPANTVAPGLLREAPEKEGDSSPGGPQMAQENLFFNPLPATARPALGDPAVPGSPQSDERHSLAFKNGQTPTMGLAPEWDCFFAFRALRRSR
ncbi:UNVERIFIED_CONTAM: hypothetical protein FKN15_043183 [Acipenser sinensis]